MPRILLYLVALFAMTVGRAESAAQPNFLIILADDLGYEALGSYGGLDYQTPELDQMAAEGLRFSRAYVEPVCTPTRVSLHTGLYSSDHGHTSVLPVHNGTSDYVDFDAMPTFAQLFQAAGYQTSTTGKWQLATLTEHPDHIANAGFDSWCIWQIWDGEAKTERFWDPYLNRDGAVLTGLESSFGPDVLNEYVKERMATAVADGEPFMIVHNEMLPHAPLTTTPDHNTASLANMVNYMDKLAGELLDEVEALGIRDNTYVIFIGDNGTDTSATRHTEDGSVDGGKRDLSDSGTHAPWIVWGPPSMPVGVNDDLVHITDIFPTLCSLAGVSIPDTIEYRGVSFVPQLEGRTGHPREWVTAGCNGFTVFDGEWRLNSDGKLYDARNLPAEPEVTTPTDESEAARVKLQRVLDYLLNGPSVSANGQVIDNDDSLQVTVTGEWKNSSATAGFIGSDYLHDLNTGQGTKSVEFRYQAADSGDHLVELRWTSLSNRASNVPVEVITPAGTTTHSVNQRNNGGAWNTLTTVSLNAGDELVVRISNTGVDGYVIVDAVRILSAVSANFSAWRSLQFGDELLMDMDQQASVWGQDADPDGDGLSNELEFALGGRPLAADRQASLFDCQWQGAGATLRLTRLSGQSVSPECSTTLADDWAPIESLFTLVGTAPISQQYEEVTYAAADLPSPLFLRVNAPAVQ